MGVRSRDFRRALEKETRKKQTLQQAMDAAAKKSKVKTGKAEEGLIKKTRRRLRELLHGKKTYLKKGKEKWNK